MPPVPPAPPRRGGRAGIFCALVLGALLLGGCRVDATVETRVKGRSGVVSARFALDREAVELLGGVVDQGLQVEDLRRAGWHVSRPRATRSGGTVVEVSKGFARPGELGRVMAELSGPDGPLQGFRLERRRSLARVRYRLQGRADLRGGEAATGFGNVPDLPRRLRGAGVDPRRVEELVTSRAAAGFGLRVAVDLPGSPPVVREVPVGRAVAIDVSSRAPDRARLLLLVLAALAALAAAALMSGGRGRDPTALSRRLPWLR